MWGDSDHWRLFHRARRARAPHHFSTGGTVMLRTELLQLKYTDGEQN